MKKLLSLAMAAAMTLSLAACSGSPGADSSAPAGSQAVESSAPSAAPENSTEPTGGEKYVVGLCQPGPLLCFCSEISRPPRKSHHTWSNKTG